MEKPGIDPAKEELRSNDEGASLLDRAEDVPI